MVPSESEWQFLLACLKHTNAKPDFDAVAQETGMTDSMAAVSSSLLLFQTYGVFGSTAVTLDLFANQSRCDAICDD